MRKYFDLVLKNQGQPISGALVTVRLAGTLTSATLYEDEGITPKANPVTTDSGGLYWFYVDNGLYDLVIQALNFATITLTNVLIEDAATSTDLSNSTDISKGDALVAGKRTDTGAVAFTLHEYNENRWLNVKTDFGAIGDNSTDDSAAFQLAFTNGADIEIPEGTYYLGNTNLTGGDRRAAAAPTAGPGARGAKLPGEGPPGALARARTMWLASSSGSPAPVRKRESPRRSVRAGGAASVLRGEWPSPPCSPQRVSAASSSSRARRNRS